MKSLIDRIVLHTALRRDLIKDILSAIDRAGFMIVEKNRITQMEASIKTLQENIVLLQKQFRNHTFRTSTIFGNTRYRRAEK